MLKLTIKELENIIRGNIDRFKKVFYDIPLYHPEHIREPGETHHDYYEDDGRAYMWFIFLDTVTGKEYTINVVHHPEWPVDILLIDYRIEIVTDSVLNLTKE